jgi:hypothetical protein
VGKYSFLEKSFGVFQKDNFDIFIQQNYFMTKKYLPLQQTKCFDTEKLCADANVQKSIFTFAPCMLLHSHSHLKLQTVKNICETHK